MITSDTDICFNVNDSDNSCKQTRREYDVKNMPDNFLSSEIARLAISKCVETMLTSKETQTEIDSLYDSVCDVYYAEMNALLNYKMLVKRHIKEVDILLNHFGQTGLSVLWAQKNLTKYFFNLKNKEIEKINFRTSAITNIYLIGDLERQKGNTTGKWNEMKWIGL